MAVDPKEVALIERARDGDEAAFRSLMETYQRRTYWIAYNMLHNYELAQDISQDAFIRVFNSRVRFDTRKKFYTWLYQIVTNLFTKLLRRLGPIYYNEERDHARSYETHRRLLAALELSDADAACAIVSEILDYSEAKILQAMRRLEAEGAIGPAAGEAQ